MNIRETLDAMEVKGVVLALDIGEHGACDLESNCPIAIQVRKLISESGITMAQIMEGLVQTTRANPLVDLDTAMSTATVNAKLAVRVGSKNFDLDMSDLLREEARRAMDNKIAGLEEQRQRIKRLGESLYHTYLDAVQEARRNKQLPQFKASVAELIRYNVSITADSYTYLFVFEVEYNPEYLITGGVRLKLS